MPEKRKCVVDKKTGICWYPPGPAKFVGMREISEEEYQRLESTKKEAEEVVKGVASFKEESEDEQEE